MKIDYKVKLTDVDSEEAENYAATHFVLSHIIIQSQNKEQLPVSTHSSVAVSSLKSVTLTINYTYNQRTTEKEVRPSGDTDDCELCLLTLLENNVPPKYHVPLFQLVTNYSQREECNTLSHSPVKYAQLFTTVRERENNRILKITVGGNTFSELKRGCSLSILPLVSISY